MSRAQSHHEQLHQACPECGGRVSPNQQRTEWSCDVCGLVTSENYIDPGPEWRTFSPGEEDEKARTGLPESVSFEHPGTHITPQSGSSQRELTRKQEMRARRLRRTDKFQKKSSSERRLTYALCEIRRMVGALGLPEQLRDVASTIYRRAVNEDLVHGRSIEGIASAAISLAARQAGVPRTYREIASVSRVEQDEIETLSRSLSRELRLEVEPSTPVDYLAQFCSHLEVRQASEQAARDALHSAMRAGDHIGKNPAGFAAGAIYAASNQFGGDLLQKDAANTADVSADTVRTHANYFESGPFGGESTE